jgi:hypothetical protein
MAIAPRKAPLASSLGRLTLAFAASLLFSAAAHAHSGDHALPPPDPELAAAFRARIHSHNDYVQRLPLHEALRQGISSIEADVYWQWSTMRVSHEGYFSKGTLEDLYLKQLQTIVNHRGSVYGDGKPFLLWIEPKRGSRELMQELDRILSKYPMLTRYTPQGGVPGPVSVILTGYPQSRIDYVDDTRVRYATRDSDVFSDQDPPADDRWDWYDLLWRPWMNDPAKLTDLVKRIHAKGRKLRLVSVPENEASWRVAFGSGADLIATDHLERTRLFTEQLAREAGQRHPLTLKLPIPEFR